MQDLEQIGVFFKTLSDPQTWIIVGGVLITLFLLWMWRTQRIVDLLGEIEKNTRSVKQDISDSNG